MDDKPDIARVAFLLGDPARARMLTALMDGRARTATELALEGGVAPSTASSHLSKLAELRLIATVRQGRHRYYRLSGPEIVAVLEGLMTIAPRGGGPAPRFGPREEGLRYARVCYDHLAGDTAVRLLAALRARQCVRVSKEAITLTNAGREWFSRLGVDVDAPRATRRPLCRPCLDWSERTFHLAGALGAGLLDRILALRYARRDPGSRSVSITPRGEAFLTSLETVPRQDIARRRRLQPVESFGTFDLDAVSPRTAT